MSRQFGSIFLFCILLIFANCEARISLFAGEACAVNSRLQANAVALRCDNFYVCSGAIINPTKILSTASCVSGCSNNSMTIYAGSPSLSSGGNVYNVSNFTIPDGFVSGQFARDIAVVTLATPMNYSNAQRPVGLPDKDIFVDTFGVVSGWGIKSRGDAPNNLGIFTKTIVAADKCNTEYFSRIGIQVDTNYFCGVRHADNPGFCNGNAGSPLIQEGKVVGILSWGAGCEYPEAFVNVYKYMEFIQQNLQ